MKCPRKLNSFFLWVALLLCMTCLGFSVGKAASSRTKAKIIKKEKIDYPSSEIKAQQKEIQKRLKRIEKKMRGKQRNASKSN